MPDKLRHLKDEAADDEHGHPICQTLGQRRAVGAEGAAQRQEDARPDGHRQAAQEVARLGPRREIQSSRHARLEPQTARKPAAANRTM